MTGTQAEEEVFGLNTMADDNLFHSDIRKLRKR